MAKLQENTLVVLLNVVEICLKISQAVAFLCILAVISLSLGMDVGIEISSYFCMKYAFISLFIGYGLSAIGMVLQGVEPIKDNATPNNQITKTISFEPYNLKKHQVTRNLKKLPVFIKKIKVDDETISFSVSKNRIKAAKVTIKEYLLTTQKEVEERQLLREKEDKRQSHQSDKLITPGSVQDNTSISPVNGFFKNVVLSFKRQRPSELPKPTRITTKNTIPTPPLTNTRVTYINDFGFNITPNIKVCPVYVSETERTAGRPKIFLDFQEAKKITEIKSKLKKKLKNTLEGTVAVPEGTPGVRIEAHPDSLPGDKWRTLTGMRFKPSSSAMRVMAVGVQKITVGEQKENLYFYKLRKAITH